MKWLEILIMKVKEENDDSLEIWLYFIGGKTECDVRISLVGSEMGVSNGCMCVCG